MNIYEMAVSCWGEHAQFDMVIEECAELIKAIQKFKRNRTKKSAIIEEAVDVELMIEQLKVIINNKEKWNEIRSNKLTRLANLIANTKEFSEQ